MALITVGDVPQVIREQLGEETLALIVDGLNAKALRIAPCLADAGHEQAAEAKLILIGALTRMGQAGSGAFTQQSYGPFSVSTDNRNSSSGYNLWPSEVTGLQDLCRPEASDGGGAFMIDMTGLGQSGAPLAGASINDPNAVGQWSEEAL